MQFLKRAAIAAGISLLAASAAMADTVKIGIIAPLTGPFAITGKTWVNTIKAYQKIHGTEVGGNTIELVWRDQPELDPARARASAQELIIKEKAQYVAGLFLSPDALGAAEIATEAEVPIVSFNAATSALLDKSEFLLRSSFTMGQIVNPMARYLAEHGMKRVVTMIPANYASGADALRVFVEALKAGGGEVVGQVEFPVTTTDFSPFIQTAMAAKPDAVFSFVPGNAQSGTFAKSFLENGAKDAGIMLMSMNGTDETQLPIIGEKAVGLLNGFVYSLYHDSELNHKVRALLKEIDPDAAMTADVVGAYDGMHILYKMIEATGGKPDAAKALAAVKGMSWESPRGPVAIDAQTRDFIQNVYIREVAKLDDGTLYNKEIAVFEAQPDHGRAH